MIKPALQNLFVICLGHQRQFVWMMILLCISTIGFANTDKLVDSDPVKGTISFFLWLDFDTNEQYDFGEQILKDVAVELYEVERDSLLRRFEVVDEGRFYFKDLPKGNYYISITFLNEKVASRYQPVQEEEEIIVDDSRERRFNTGDFHFDPAQTNRKNINIPFYDSIQSSILLDVTCTDFIDTTFIEMTIENCDNMLSICIDEAIGDMLGYAITDNGEVYTGLVSPCDFDTSFAYTYSSIPGAGTAGPYMVDTWTLDGMIYQGQVADMAALTDSMNNWDAGGNWNHDILTASIRGGNTSVAYGNIEITQVPTSIDAVMSLNTTLNPNGTQLSLDTGYHELIFWESVDNCFDTLEVIVDCIPCEELYSGSSNFELDNCNDNEAICFDISNDDVSSYNILNNGFSYNGITNPCGIDSFYQYQYAGLPGGGVFGPYLLQSWTVDGTTYLGGFNNVGDLLDSMNLWDLGGNWQISDPLQTITGGNPAKTYSDLEVVQIISNTPGTAPVEQIASATSMEIILDTGFHEIVFYNINNECTDTFGLTLSCAPCPEYLSDTLISLTAVDCDSSTTVCLPIPFDEINDYNVILNGGIYTDGFLSCTDMNSMIELDTGTYQFLFEHNITGCLESATIMIDCIPQIICNDFINEELVHIQISDCNLSGALCVEIPFDEISDYTIENNGAPFFGTFENCQGGTTLNLETGFHEIIFTHDSLGCMDSIKAMVVCLESETLNTLLTVGGLDTICLDTTSLLGYVVSINNVCEDNSGELAIVEILNESYCIQIEGVEGGTEQACIEVCDNYGYCDTTFINIEVEPLIIEPDLAPIANDDDVQLEQEGKVSISVLENDEINGVMNSFGILVAPTYGTAIIIENTFIEYTPDPAYCTTSAPDSLTYVICNDEACDEATVKIAVNCKEIFVHNGFSPNGDGQNEYFVINGASNNPNNSLSVFNRYGGRVFHTKGYQNNWDGTWEGEDLPDGTYFYYFEDGTGSTASGYVQIQR